ncbi:hypothetical protein ABPG75_000616 [Micractinium tetrahymenae]
MGASGSRPATHRSLNCRTATMVEFCNDTQHEVETLWLGYDGAERRYYTLQPGQRVRQPTYTAHPWVFRVFRVPGAPSEQLVVQDQAVLYVPPLLPGLDKPAVEAHIRAVAGVAWSPASHAAFPPDFRAAAAALLCCHRQLVGGISSGAAPEGASGPERQGGWLRWLSRQLSGQGASPRKRAEVAQGAPQRQKHPCCCLGDLPKDLLLDVLAAAAPFVPLLVKPALPHGLEPGELSPEALQLFRQGGGGCDSEAGAGQAAGEAWAGQAAAQPEAGLPGEGQ